MKSSVKSEDQKGNEVTTLEDDVLHVPRITSTSSSKGRPSKNGAADRSSQAKQDSRAVRFSLSGDGASKANEPGFAQMNGL